MKLKRVKAILMIAFIILTVSLTWLGIKRSTAKIDFKALESGRMTQMDKQSEESFEQMLRNIGSSTSLVKPDILQSNDTARLSLSVRLLDSMHQYVYAAVLSERLAGIQQSQMQYHKAARYFLMATESGENQLMLFRRARMNLEKCIEMDPANLDAKVDLAVSIYNINSMAKSENTAEIMKPVMLLRDVVSRDSNQADAIYYLGKLAIESTQYEKAIERFKKLISLQPQNREFALELSQAYRLAGKNKEADDWEQKAKSMQ